MSPAIHSDGPRDRIAGLLMATPYLLPLCSKPQPSYGRISNHPGRFFDLVDLGGRAPQLESTRMVGSGKLYEGPSRPAASNQGVTHPVKETAEECDSLHIDSNLCGSMDEAFANCLGSHFGGRLDSGRSAKNAEAEKPTERGAGRC
jgi:hypothetical protein